jgi:endo-1,4-beta-xylanase
MRFFARSMLVALVLGILPAFGLSAQASAPLAGDKLDSFAYDFEKDGKQGWGPRGGGVLVAAVPEAAHSGALGLRASSRGENWHGAAIGMAGVLKRGAVYEFSAYLRLAGAPASASAVKFTMEEKSGGKTAWKTVAQAEVKDAAWVKLAGSYSFDAAMDELSLYAESSAPSDVIYIDDILLRMVKPAPASPPLAIEKNLKPLMESFAGYFLAGVAVNPNNIQGPTGELINKHFNCLVAENAMKSLYIHPTEADYYWDDADAIVKYAKANTKVLRYHTLLWHEQCAPWFFLDREGKQMADERDPAKRAENKALLLDRLDKHVRTIVSRYKDDIRYWDVVNEVIDAKGPDGLRESAWYKIAGPDYIETAFRSARAAGGNKVKLYINDYGTQDPAKRDALYKLVKGLLAKGVPIDGVGHQCHITLTSPPLNQLYDSIKLFGSLGLDNQVTELDMSVYSDDMTSYASVSDELLARQGYRYKELFDLFKSLNKEISCVCFWGLVDSSSWLQNRPIKRTEAPLLFNNELKAKPAFYGIVDPAKLPPPPAPPKPKAAPKLGEAPYGRPAVDGLIEADWARAKAMEVSLVAAGKPQAIARARAMWDEDFLYVLMEVSDPLLNEASADAYQKDSVEVFMDENRERTTTYQGDDGQYRVNYLNARSFGSNGEEKRLLSASAVVPGGYIVEMAIPFRTIKGEAGTMIGFDAQVNDADASGKRVGISKWNDDTDESWRNTLNYGTLKLVK